MDNFSRPFHGHHYYGLILSDLCPSVEKFLKKNAFSVYDLNGHAFAQEPLPLKVMKLKILVDPSLVIITM